jgi:lipid A 3-O-deacylase
VHKQLKKIVAGFIATLVCLMSSAQLIDHTSTFRNIQSKSYFRFHYDNDFFTKTDNYYSQGITAEYVHPALKKFLLTKLLIKSKNSDTRYGITFNIFGYTPSTIESDAILYGDRPYESSMSFKTFLTGSDSIHQHRIASSFSLGVIGPLAQGKEIQTGIHRWLNNRIPKGWQHQVQNDIIINYKLNYEKKLMKTGKRFLLNGAAEAKLGTLHNRVSGGFNFMIGNFNNPYQTDKRKKIEYYLYVQSRVNFIGYDATMQGGLFNRKSPYTISSGDVSRITFQSDAGMIVNFKKLYLSYTQSFLTKEFRTGRYHRWGGISFGFSF